MTILVGTPVPAPRLHGRSDLLLPTRKWWDTWATSPQAATFLATDWQRLVMLVPLVEEYFAEPRPTILAEIRLNEGKLGATKEDRHRLRWDVRPGEGESGEKTPRTRRDPRLTLVKEVDQ